MFRIQISLSFIQGTYGENEEFCQQVVMKTDGVVRYAELQPQVDIVKPLLVAFVNAVAAASDGGKLLTQAKLNAKADLLAAMEDMAAMTKVFAKGDKTYVTEAGFELRKKGVKSDGPLDRPEWSYLKRGILSGTVEGEVKNFPKGVNELGIKHSDDGWATERNGTYSSGKKFVLSGLDPKKEVEVKICFLGTFQRKSDDSVAMPIFVL